MTRRLLNLLTALSLLLCAAAAAALWVRTEVLGHTDTISWGPAGVFRCVAPNAGPNRAVRWVSCRECE